MAVFPTNNLHPLVIGGIPLPIEPSKIEIRQSRDYEITDVPLRDGTVKQFLGTKDVEIMVSAHIDALPALPDGSPRDFRFQHVSYEVELANAFKRVVDMFQDTENGILPLQSWLTDLLHVKWVALKDFQLTSAGGRARSMVPYSLSMVSDDGGYLQSMLFADIDGAFIGKLRAAQRAKRQSMKAVGFPPDASVNALTPEQWAAVGFGSSKLGIALRKANSAHLAQAEKDQSLRTVNKVLGNLGLSKPVFTFRAQTALGSSFAQADPLGDGPWLRTGSTSVFVPSSQKETIYGLMDSVYGRGGGKVDEVLRVNPHLSNPMAVSGDTVTFPGEVPPSVAHEAAAGRAESRLAESRAGSPHSQLSQTAKSAGSLDNPAQ